MTERGRLLVLGAGGYAKVLVAAAQEIGWKVIGCLDDDPALAGASVLGVPILGGIELAPSLEADKCVIGVGENRPRLSIAEKSSPAWATLVHPLARVHESVILGDGAVVLAGAVVEPDVQIEPHAVVDAGAIVGHDCVLGESSFVAAGVSLGGSVRIGQGALVGMGASILPGLSVGSWSVVGGGATVIANIPGGVTAVGTPARIIEWRS